MNRLPCEEPRAQDGVWCGVAAPSRQGGRRVLACAASVRPVIANGTQVPYWLDMRAADLGRLNSGRAPVLLDHCHAVGSIVGVVERAWTDDDHLYALLRLGPSREARAAWAQIAAGVLCNVSIGLSGRFTVEPDASGACRSTVWRPYEVSFVAVPADWSARVYPGAPPRPIVERLAARIAAEAGGAPDTWRTWAENAGTRLAAAGPDDLPAALRAAVEEELARLGRDAAARVWEIAGE